MSVLLDLMRYRAQQKATILPHWNRVRADGGVFYDTSNKYLQALADDNQKYGSTLKLCINPALTGNKIRTSGVNNFATKSYDISTVKNDATQTTATNQPYLSKIAPIEKPSLLNPNGNDCYMTHPTISFGASDAWSVEVVLNWNAGNSENGVIASDNSSNNLILLNHNTYGRKVSLRLNGIFYTFSNYPLNETLSKNTIFLIVKTGSFLYLYVNGVLKDAISSVNNQVALSTIYYGVSSSGNYNGKFYHYSIFSKALSASEVASRAALLRSIYPEIESVPIGTQTWSVRNFEAVCTPQGNLIPEMQAATNTENVPASSQTFDTDGTSWYSVNEATKTYDSVNKWMNITSNGTIGRVTNATQLSNYIGKWYKVSYSAKSSNFSGALNFVNQVYFRTYSINNPNLTNTFQTVSFYAYGTGTFGYLYLFIYLSSGYSVDIDNVSIQSVGWSDSQNLYDCVYANTAGTTEQKTYAAVKAAAMWCHYSNDPANGAIYSKLYNDFAIKLLDMDIAYYNTANPSTPWGWDVPDEPELEALQTTIDNDANALEHQSTTYWTSGQGTNTTGFTALPGGYRKEDGTFAGINTTAIFGSTNMDIPRLGKSLRLIKR